MSPSSTRADEVLFPLGRPCGEVAELAAAVAGRTRAGCRGQPVEQGVEVGDGQARLGGRCAHRRRQAAPADADATLARLADEEPDGRRDLVGLELREQRGERIDLRQSRPGGRDGVGGVHERIEQHGTSLAPASDAGRGVGYSWNRSGVATLASHQK